MEAGEIKHSNPRTAGGIEYVTVPSSFIFLVKLTIRYKQLNNMVAKLATPPADWALLKNGVMTKAKEIIDSP